MNIKINKYIPVLAILFFFASGVTAQTTAFSYQGRLNTSGNPANGTYEMQFQLFDSAKGGVQIGATVTDSSVAVTNGVFTTMLDFGAAAFDGSERFLEVGVRPANDPNPFTLLSPRQSINSVPYAVRSTNAANASQLGGVDASEYVTTINGATNFIQNTTTQQAGANLNIDGKGTVGSLDANGPVSMIGTAEPATAPAGQGRIYFDAATNKVKVSENSGAFVDLVGASGVSGSGTVNSIPLFSAGTMLGSSLISQSGGSIQLPSAVSLAATASGNNIAFGSPNSGTGMTISGPTTRADVRLDGTTLRLNVGPAGNIPANGIGIDSNGTVQLPSGVSLTATASGNNVAFGSPNSETGMTISGPAGRADLRFNGSTLKLVAGPGGQIPSSANGLSIDTNGKIAVGAYSGSPGKLMVDSVGEYGVVVKSNFDTNFSLGAAVRGDNAGNGSGVLGVSNNGTGIYGSSGNGTGVLAESSNLGTGLRVVGKSIFNGNAIQDRDKGGMVKSMLYITYDGGSATIVRCFDAITNSSISPCTTVANRAGNFLTIGYPFQIDDRFLSLTTLGGTAGIASISGTQIVFLVGSGASGSFYIYVY